MTIEWWMGGLGDCGPRCKQGCGERFKEKVEGHL